MEIRCVAGLGNPGPRYEWTRHNVGFLVLDRFAAARGWRWSRGAEVDEAEGSIDGRDVVLVKPMGFMNRSGASVRESLALRQLGPEQLLVVVDDAALPLGRIRIRRSGGSGGHRGLESIEQEVGSTSYRRLRIGVGPPPEGEDLADYLLAPMAGQERERFERIAGRVADLLAGLLREGVEWAMNRHNADPVEGEEGDAGGRAGKGDQAG